MLTLLNIGNTHTEIGVWSGGVLSLERVIPSSQLESADLPSGDIAAASVVPDIAQRLAAKRQINFITASNCHDLIDFSIVDSAHLGADRVANAVALAHFFPLPALVADCGTAITIEIVDSNRRFIGGSISPGRMLMRKSLALGTAQLPEIPLDIPVPEFAGIDTKSSIALGVDGGIGAMLAALVDKVKKNIDIASCVITGGDAGFFQKALPGVFLPAPELFTLCGILLATGEKISRKDFENHGL